MNKLLDTRQLYYILCQGWTPALELKLKMPVRKFCYWVLHGLWMDSLIGEKLTVREEVMPRGMNLKFEHACTDADVLKKLSFWQPYLEVDVAEFYELGKRQKDYILKVAKNHGFPAMFLNHQVNKPGEIIIAEENLLKDMTDYFKRGAELVRHYNVGQYLGDFELGKEHNKLHFHHAIAQGFTKQPRLKYHPSGDPKFDLIHEVHLCFDLNFQPIDCPMPDHQFGAFLYPKCCGNVDKAIVDMDENDPERYAPC